MDLRFGSAQGSGLGPGVESQAKLNHNAVPSEATPYLHDSSARKNGN